MTREQQIKKIIETVESIVNLTEKQRFEIRDSISSYWKDEFDEAYKEGYKDAKYDSYEDGKEDGYDEGYDVGYDDGYYEAKKEFDTEE